MPKCAGKAHSGGASIPTFDTVFRTLSQTGRQAMAEVSKNLLVAMLPGGTFWLLGVLMI
jgi:hypothetical protein